jgi:hypothetical protein
MGLPSSRDQTFTPLSPVAAAFLNGAQDAIVGLYNRISGGAGAAISSLLAVVAPDFKNTTPRNRVIPGSMGAPGTGTNHWGATSPIAVTTGVTGNPGLWTLPIPVEEGERVTISVMLSQSLAPGSLGLVTLWREGDSASRVSVGTADIANTTAIQTLVLATDHDVVPGYCYGVEISFAASSSTTYYYAYRAKVAYIRP